MIYKEFKDIYKIVLILLSSMVIIPVIHSLKASLVITSYETGAVSHVGYSGGNVLYFSIIAGIIIMISGVLGLNMFSREYKDKSFEYLLSTPLTKKEILLNKIIPRLIIIFALIIIYTITFYIYFKEPDKLKDSFHVLVLPKFLLLWMIFNFLITLFLSIFKQKNWIAFINLLTLYMIFVTPFSIRLILRNLSIEFQDQAHLIGYSFIISFIILIFLLGICFIISYKKLDLREKHFVGNKFSKLVIPSEVFLLIIFVIILLN